MKGLTICNAMQCILKGIKLYKYSVIVHDSTVIHIGYGITGVNVYYLFLNIIFKDTCLVIRLVNNFAPINTKFH